MPRLRQWCRRVPVHYAAGVSGAELSGHRDQRLPALMRHTQHLIVTSRNATHIDFCDSRNGVREMQALQRRGAEHQRNLFAVVIERCTGERHVVPEYLCAERVVVDFDVA